MAWSPSADDCVLQVHVPQCEHYDHGDAAPPAEVAAGNLRLILMAVNSYHGVLRALKNARAFIELNEPHAIELIRELDEAVAKATEEPWGGAPSTSG
jgi:hypothetical protein